MAAISGVTGRSDIANPNFVAKVMAEAQIDTVVHFAAESHVDRSIADPQKFIRTNVLGTQVLLEAARRQGVTRFIQISTDEVYGTLGPEKALYGDAAACSQQSLLGKQGGGGLACPRVLRNVRLSRHHHPLLSGRSFPYMATA